MHSEQLAEVRGRKSGVVENSRKRAPLDRSPLMHMHGDHSQRSGMVQNVRTSAHADHDESGAFEGAHKPAAFNGREFLAQNPS